MSLSTRTSGRKAVSHRRPTRSLASPELARSHVQATQAHASSEPDTSYGTEFWLIYLANGLTMTAISMLVRYADFVAFLGGGEAQLGLIVGVGMVGSLSMRVAQGVGIDRYGSRRIWLGSLALYIFSALAHQVVASPGGPGIFAVRILMQTSLAGIFGSSITYISRRVPPQRMAEMVGTVGISGFLGMLIGPQLSDWICGHGQVGQAELNRMFQVSALLATGALVIAAVATRRASATGPRRIPPVWAVLRRYQPGLILLVAAAAGVGLNLPSTFLRAMAAERGVASIGTFFSVYAVTAVAVRLLTRNQFVKYGNRPWVIGGMVTLAASMGLYVVVESPWQWTIPGSLAGVAHAVLFPSVVAGGSTAFPERYRGLGTTLMLAMFDAGNLVGAPLVGGIVHFARELSLPAYPTMIVAVTICLLLVTAVYARANER